MDENQQQELALKIAASPDWRVLGLGIDQSGGQLFVAAYHVIKDQAHQFRSEVDWVSNSKLIASGGGTGNLGTWSTRNPQTWE